MYKGPSDVTGQGTHVCGSAVGMGLHKDFKDPIEAPTSEANLTVLATFVWWKKGDDQPGPGWEGQVYAPKAGEYAAAKADAWTQTNS